MIGLSDCMVLFEYHVSLSLFPSPLAPPLPLTALNKANLLHFLFRSTFLPALTFSLPQGD